MSFDFIRKNSFDGANFRSKLVRRVLSRVSHRPVLSFSSVFKRVYERHDSIHLNDYLSFSSLPSFSAFLNSSHALSKSTLLVQKAAANQKFLIRKVTT